MSQREQNKAEKLARITAAAQSLFSEKGISEVTTNQVAVKAGVATGTLFLYAKTKGELLLLAQNASYNAAHIAGIEKSSSIADVKRALIALLTPIVFCNREHVENGRTYLREVVFGEGLDQHRQSAMALMAGTEDQVAAILQAKGKIRLEASRSIAKNIMATLFLTLSSPLNVDATNETIVAEIEKQISLVLG